MHWNAGQYGGSEGCRSEMLAVHTSNVYGLGSESCVTVNKIQSCTRFSYVRRIFPLHDLAFWMPLILGPSH